MKYAAQFVVPVVALAAFCALPGRAQQSAPPGASVSLELRTQEGFDDGVGGERGGSTFFEFVPLWSAFYAGRRSSFSLRYAPTFRHTGGLAIGDRLDHALDLEADVRASKTVTLSFKQSARYVSNPFSLLGDSSGASAAAGPSLPVFVGLDQRVFRMNSSVTLERALSSTSTVSIGGSFFREHQANERMLDREAWGLRGSYRKNYSKNKSVTVFASHQNFELLNANTTVKANSVFLQHEHEFHPGTRLTVFAGPQLSKLHSEQTISINLFFFNIEKDLIADEWLTGYAYGVKVQHEVTDRTSFTVDYTRQIADSGPFIGTSRQKSFRVDLSHKFTPRVTWYFGASTSSEAALGGIGPDTDLRTANSGTGFRFALTRKTRLELRHQFTYYSNVPEELRGLANRNRISASLVYKFGFTPDER